MANVLGLQISMLHEIAEEHGYTGRSALVWCQREGLVERAGFGYRLTHEGLTAVSEHLYKTPQKNQATVSLVPRRNADIVIARTMQEALAQGR